MFENALNLLKGKLTVGVAEFERNRFLYAVGAAPFLLAIVTIFWNFQRMGLSHWDEYYFVETAAASLKVGWGSFWAYDPPLFPFLLSIMFRVFGLQDYVAVATSGLMALLLCILTFWWTKREYDFSTAIVSTLILASIAVFISYAKMALTDMTFTFFFSASIFAYMGSLRRRSNWAFLVAGLVLTCTFATKYNGFQPIIVILIFVPFSCLSIFEGKTAFRKKVNSYLRQVVGSLPGLWVSLAPVLLFSIVFLAFLGRPFAPSLLAFTSLARDFIPRLNDGLTFLVRAVYSTKPMVNSLQLLVNVEYYGYVLTEFVGLPALVLAVIGGVRGILKRQTNTILLIMWVGFVFIYFSSLPGYEAPRLILPLVVPLAILTGQGTLWCATTIVRFLQGFDSSLRQKRLGASLKAGFVIAVVLVNLYSSIPAITNTHSAYRQAAEFIIANVPSGELVWCRSQIVLWVYFNMFGKNVNISTDVSQISQAYAVVLDFVAAKSSPDYLRIQTQISQMTLAARIRNDAGTINMLDSWTPLSGFQQFESDPDRLSIRIYIQSSRSVSNSPSQLYSAAQVDNLPNLFPSMIAARRTISQIAASHLQGEEMIPQFVNERAYTS